MNYQNAHGYMEDLQRILTTYRFMFSKEFAEANGKAIIALEKQIPKKPRKMVFGFVKESYDYSCPTCGNRIISKIDGEWCAGAKYKFCVNCGQPLDWSDEE